jgi:hypothetical protein
MKTSPLSQLANIIKSEIMQGDASAATAEEHYAKAGRALSEAKASVEHGKWRSWLSNHVQIGERRAQELIELGAKKKTVAQVRTRIQKAMRKNRSLQPKVTKSASRDADSPPHACDYDWSNVKVADFGNPTKAYKAQAEQYCREALHLAEAFPLLSNKIDRGSVTDKEIQNVREVTQAWLKLTETLTQRKLRGVA